MKRFSDIAATLQEMRKMNKITDFRIKLIWSISLVLGSVLHAISSKYLQMSYLRIASAMLSTCTLIVGFTNIGKHGNLSQLFISLIFFTGIKTVWKSPSMTKKTAAKYLGVIAINIIYFLYVVIK